MLLNLLNWKRPKAWVVMLAFVVCIAVIAGCAFNAPKTKISEIFDNTIYTIMEEQQKEFYLTMPKKVLKEEAYTNEGQTFDKNEVIAYETDTTKIYLEKVMISNEGEDLMYLFFNYSYDLSDEGTVLVPYTKTEDGFKSDYRLKSNDIIDANQTIADVVHIRGDGPEETVVFYLVTEACKNAEEFIQIHFSCNEVTYHKGADDNADSQTYPIETFEETSYTKDWDSYDEYIHHTYYKMSDGTWAADVQLNDEEESTRYDYKYRIVYHDRMPNAAIDDNYIILSNTKDITFRQVFMATGISSNMEDYFDPRDTIIIASWLGALEFNHPEKVDDTIYHVVADAEEDRIIDCMDYSMVFPDNTNWVSKLKYYNVDQNNRKVIYHDFMAEADCVLYASRNNSISLDNDLDETLTEEWEARTMSNSIVPVFLKYGADKSDVYAIWEYEGYQFLIQGIFTGENRDGSPIAKTALHIISKLP